MHDESGQVEVGYADDPDASPELFEPHMVTLAPGTDASAQEGARAFFLQRPPLGGSGFSFSEGARELFLGFR